jgi:ABC-type multidrug transport system ATPase subunit
MATLEALMERLGVTYLVERNAPEGFSATKSWETELSKGEAQCIGLLRLLYHQPQWALLDECTSAMAHELQSQCYQLLAERGIATISAVSQHDEEALEMLRPFHAQELTLTLLDPPDQITVGAKYAGEGIAGWTVTDLKERPAAATDRVEPLDLAGSTEHCAEGEGEAEAEAEGEGEGECHDAGEEEEGDAMGRAGK